jgi:hypothetical protein
VVATEMTTSKKRSVMHQPTLFLMVGSALLASAAQAENSISYQTYKYVESNQRIKVLASDLSIEKDFGTDYTARLDIGVDAISGATPSWLPKPGYANEYVSGHTKVSDESRNSISGGLSMRDAKRNEYTFGLAYSHEPDFVSKELSAQGMWWHDESHNRSYIAGLGVQLNTAIATAHTNNTTDRDSHAFNVQFGVNQVLDRTNTVEGSVYFGRESGYLSNHYLSIVRDDGTGQHTLAEDSRPALRQSGGVSVRWIKSWRNDLKTNLWYRFYKDDWGITGHTIEGKAYWDLNEQWRVNPVLRLTQQDGANFYRGYGDAVNTFASTGFGSNDARLGPISAVTGQLNLEYHASKEWTLNAGLSRYRQDTGLSATWLTAGFVFKY